MNHEGREEHKAFAQVRRSGQVSRNRNWRMTCFVCTLCLADQTAFMNASELFCQETNTLKLAPGDFLFREGDSGEEMYLLLEGEIEIFLGDFVIETAGAGMLIGEMALIEDNPRTAHAVARTACRLAKIDRRRFYFLVQQTPHFATHVMKTLADRLRHMNAVAAVR